MMLDRVMKGSYKHLPLDQAPIVADRKNEEENINEKIDREILLVALNGKVKLLPLVQRRIYYAMFIDGKSERMIAEEFRLTRYQVRKHEAEVIHRLGQSFNQ